LFWSSRFLWLMALMTSVQLLSKSSNMKEITFPSAQVSTSTAGVTSFGDTLGKRMRLSPRKLRLNFCKLKASRVKSICARITSSNSPRSKGTAMCSTV